MLLKLKQYKNFDNTVTDGNYFIFINYLIY